MKLYTAFSPFEFIFILIVRLLILFGLLYSAPHYNENPVVIAIVVFLCLVFIFILGDDQIIVYQDRITQKTNSLSSLIFRGKGTTYMIRDIKSAYLQAPSSPAEIGVAVALATFIAKDTNNNDRTYPIFFDLKDGKTARMETNLETAKMKKIVELVNSLVNPKH